MKSLILGAIATTSLYGCAGPVPPPQSSAALRSAVALEDPRASALALDASEGRAFEAIAAADPRFAKRLPAPPSPERLRAAAVQALAQGDADVSIRDGNVDFFSFTARQRALDEAARDLGEDTGAAAGTSLERTLALRLVAEERARLDEEQSLPRGASALLRGVVETWTPPGSPKEATERDAWLARRLDQIRASLSSSTLARNALLELDDALDPLERLAAPDELPSSAKALARLRLALGETPPQSGVDAAKRDRLEAGVRAHLGLALDGREIRARLERAEKATRALAKGATSGLGAAEERAVAGVAEGLTLAGGACEARPAESRVRSLGPPPERASICGILRALVESAATARPAASFVALHDETVVALWALALHAEGADPASAEASAHTFFGAQPDREAKLVRFAEARPFAAIAAGLAAELLTRSGAAPADASARWLSFGDAPLDVIERELFTSAPAPPASPRP